MFPFVRILKDMFLASRQPPLANLTDTHISHHICWPHDLDFWLELNNGRALSIYDIGRLAMGQRVGLVACLRRERWGLTMAGSCTRFWDDKFTYIEQSMWKRNGECASHVLYRAAVTDANGLVAPERVLTAMGKDPASPPMPPWVQAWCAAEDQRPWPPMQQQA